MAQAQVLVITVVVQAQVQVQARAPEVTLVALARRLKDPELKVPAIQENNN